MTIVTAGSDDDTPLDEGMSVVVSRMTSSGGKTYHQDKQYVAEMFLARRTLQLVDVERHRN